MSLVTPLHFSCVQPKLYRGSYPREINLPFLKTLRLKYFLSLTPHPITDDPVLEKFSREQNIECIHVICSKKDKSKDIPKVKRKKKQVPIEYDVVVQCAQFLIDKKNYPCYIHCMNGELITSLVVACLRKLSYWSTVSIFNEYLTYTSSINIHERNFIQDFKLEIAVNDLDWSDKVPWIIIRNSGGSSIHKNGDIHDEASDLSRIPPNLDVYGV